LEKPPKPVYTFVMTKLQEGRRIGRPPVHDRAMTGAERQRRYIAKLVTKAVPPAAAGLGAAARSLVVKIEHLRRYPDRIAPWLRQRLGHHATLALRDALNQAIENPGPELDSDDDEPAVHAVWRVLVIVILIIASGGASHAQWRGDDNKLDCSKGCICSVIYCWPTNPSPANRRKPWPKGDEAGGVVAPGPENAPVMPGWPNGEPSAGFPGGATLQGALCLKSPHRSTDDHRCRLRRI
jgi:hypothetical protein